MHTHNSYNIKPTRVSIIHAGAAADSGFSSLGGGGGLKRLFTPTHITSTNPEVPYGRGSRARLRALEALGGFDVLSCYSEPHL